MTPAAASITLSPPPARWREPLAAFKPLSQTQRRFREQLGLPIDRPVLMSGHQAQFWHPGILAKLFALDAAARCCEPAPGPALAPARAPAQAWIVPDQDTAELPLIRFPARTAGPDLTIAHWPAPDPAPNPSTIPAASLPPLNPIPPGPSQQPAISSVADGLARMLAALAARAAEPTFARQVTSAALDLASRFLSSPPITLYASDLPTTDLFRELVHLARADPAVCTRAYNDAVAQTPEAHLRPLDADNPAGPELPFWRLAPASPRNPVFASQLAEIPVTQLAPRALLLTGLMRLAGCEIFIHGTGGAIYDHASELWLRAWLKHDGPLALSARATATLLLPLGVDPITPRDLARARWAAHHARHNPADVGDADAQARKRHFLDQLRALPRRSHERAAAFRDMHATLAAARRDRAAALADLDHRAADTLARSTQGAIAADRTWPFPLYPDAMITDLKASVAAELQEGCTGVQLSR